MSFKTPLLTVSLVLLALMPVNLAHSAESWFSWTAFDFIAIGDMPYTMDMERPGYDRLIEAINSANPAFTIHVGDIKGGGSPCSDARLERELYAFMRIRGALIYTPGDNEWTDCHRAAAGGYDPLERLDRVRKLFFPRPESLGQAPIPLLRQADLTDENIEPYSEMVENVLWSHRRVTFATVHVVGSNNNFETRSVTAAQEFFRRDAANIAWIRTVFSQARAMHSLGVVLALHADMFYTSLSRENGFAATRTAIAQAAETFRRPVLVIYGDSHAFEVHKPLRSSDDKILDNVTFVQVFGAESMHGVRIIVDPRMPGLFAFLPFYVPENLTYRP